MGGSISKLVTRLLDGFEFVYTPLLTRFRKTFFKEGEMSKPNKFLNPFLVFFLSTVSFSAVGQSAQFNSTTGHWYMINPTPMTWQEARVAAESAGGYLATITTGAENKWISETFGITFNEDYYWFGGNDLAIEGDWQWANGEPWSYTNWHVNEPNNSGGMEHALTWYHALYANEDGYEWNDRDPSQARASLIEFDVHPLRPQLDAWLDDRWSGQSAQALIDSINAYGLGIHDVEAMLRQGRATYPDAPQAKGVITTDLPINAEHMVHSSEYLMYVPTSYDKSQATPVIIVGHGGNSCMSLSDAQTTALWGMIPWVSFAEQHGFLMVAPSTGRGWGNIGYSILFSTLSQVQKDYNIDPDRVYVTGHSMGGHLSYRSGIYLADRWGAISPMSGGYDYVANRLVENLYNVPGFATWGEHDVLRDEDGNILVDYTVINRKIRDWMIDHGYPWRNWEKAGGGHAIFSEFIDDVGAFFLANSRYLYRHRVYAGAGPWGTQGGMNIPSLKIDEPDLNACVSVSWIASRSISASTFHWLRLSAASDASIVQRAWAVNKGDNLFEITAENVREASLYLHPAMVDFDKPVTVKVNGDVLFSGMVTPDLATMLMLVREFDDRGRIFHAAVNLSIQTDTAPSTPSFYDANNDDCVDRSDMLDVLDNIFNAASPEPYFDFNQDGSVNVADARRMVMKLDNAGAPCQ